MPHNDGQKQCFVTDFPALGFLQPDASPLLFQLLSTLLYLCNLNWLPVPLPKKPCGYIQLLVTRSQVCLFEMRLLCITSVVRTALGLVDVSAHFSGYQSGNIQWEYSLGLPLLCLRPRLTDGLCKLDGSQ